MYLEPIAAAVFGVHRLRAAVDEVVSTLRAWGASETAIKHPLYAALCDLMLTVGSPALADVRAEEFYELVNAYPPTSARRQALFKISRVLAHKGILPAPLTSNKHNRQPWNETLDSAPEEWVEWANRWRATSLKEESGRRVVFYGVLIAGRWMAAKHPSLKSPEDWTRDIAAEYVSSTKEARIGDWAGVNRNQVERGHPMKASGKQNRIDAVRSFFCDLQEWGWLNRKFDPRKVLSLPPSIRSQLGPNPRIIDDVAWAKLMAAGLTINPEDLNEYGPEVARNRGLRRTYYPIEMVRAVIVVWLFAGCRVDEIRRLDVACIRWDELKDDDTGLPYTVCQLLVPANKTMTAFVKPVDPVVGQVVDAWLTVRAQQPLIQDRKTLEYHQILFCHRGQMLGLAYINEVIIPALCRKAGIPAEDSRGALTSHRARSTIATQLLNCEEPLTLTDLQQWLGHKHPESTRHYAAILQRKLSAAYRKADYFARNVRTIQVLIDRETILSGGAANGAIWKYYDLGLGYCGYDFFAKCPHRLACVRCPFFIPKDSERGKLLAIRNSIDHLLERMDLTSLERDAIEGDRAALDELMRQKLDTPTPGGPTPRELGVVDPAFVPMTKLLRSQGN
jgi:integrase